MQAIKFVVTLCVIGFAFAEQSPVFLWGATSVAKPSLVTIAGSEFADLVTPILADKTLIVFLEKGLTNKDFLCTNTDSDGKSCFARLQGVSGKTFYASVENPIEALRSLGGEREYNSIDNSGKFENSLQLTKGKIIFVNFNDEDQSEGRRANLQSHDSIIASVSAQLGDNAFYIYTSAPSDSKAPSLRRQRRETAADSDGYVFREGADLLLYFSTLSIANQNSPTALSVNGMSVNKQNSTAMSITLTTTGAPLSFDVTLSGGYFFMTNVVYDNIKFRSSDVYSPTDFSYFCGNLTLYSYAPSDAYTLNWNSLQFQAPFGYTNNASFVFGDAWHCVGFFTGGILSGLLIVALLLTITFIGVCWMMDINTMDRFDDPKGKTITINASD